MHYSGTVSGESDGETGKKMYEKKIVDKRYFDLRVKRRQKSK